jgi:predicted AAA+ superfamily ATPase
MIQKSLMRTVIQDQLTEIERLDHIAPRDAFDLGLSYNGSSAFIIKGIRRCGKSTMLKQIINTRFRDSFFYFNFDDERISGFAVEDFQVLMETFIELFGDMRNVFFDEIQNVKGWELFINRLLREGYRVFITGSNSSHLSMELGTHLTGRHVDMELYPFSFLEFLRARSIDLPKNNYSPQWKATAGKLFNEYYLSGGMPDSVVSGSNSVLTQPINDIIQNDVMNRYNIRKFPEIRDILRFLMSNVSNEITYRSITRNLSVKSENTVKKYMDYLQETYIIFEVKRFDRKLKRAGKSPRKVYCIDNGIILRNVPNFYKNNGALLENLIAVELKRSGTEFYYYRHESNTEVDFVLPVDRELIQVSFELNDQNIEREIRGLERASGEIDANRFLILTMDQEREIFRNGLKIEVKPVWRWLMENVH